MVVSLILLSVSVFSFMTIIDQAKGETITTNVHEGFELCNTLLPNYEIPPEGWETEQSDDSVWGDIGWFTSYPYHDYPSYLLGFTPDLPHNGTSFAFSWNKYDNLTSPKYNFTSKSSIVFWYRAEGGTSCYIDVTLDDGNDTLLWSDESISTTYHKATINMSEYAGEAYSITFRQPGENDLYGVAIDDVVFYNVHTAVGPKSMTEIVTESTINTVNVIIFITITMALINTAIGILGKIKF